MKKIIVYIFLTLLTGSVYGKIPESNAIDKIFSEWDKPNSPGASIGIIKNGELIYARGYGMANLEYDIPNSPTSVFRIASTSKQFTAASIILLVEKGKLNLDDSLDKFFSDFPDYAKGITIAHLLNHTSGIRDYLTLSYLAGLNNDDYYTDVEVLKWLENQQETNFKPGEKFLYSNSGYWLLGQIVEIVTGENMAVFAKNEIFIPLKMTNTHFHNDHNQIVKNRSSGYIPNNNDGYQISMTTLNMIGDGGIFTSVEDMKKWDDAFYESKTLSQKFWEMMTKQGRLNDGEVLDYASGLRISEYKGLKTVNHGGDFVGFRADLIRFPEHKFSVMIFANRGDANPSQMGYKVADIFLKNKFQESESVESEKQNNKVSSVKLTPKQLKRWQADYWYDEGSFSRKLYVKDNSLRYYRSENSEQKLIPVNENTFKMEGADNVVITFSENKDKIKTMSVVVKGRKPNVALEYQPISYSSEEMRTFAGEYFSRELNVTYHLRMADSELQLYINNKETSPMQAVKEKLLTNKDYGTFHFNQNKSGNIVNFKLASGRVTNLLFVKL